MLPDERLRAQVVETSRALHARGWVANHDGNVTARCGERLISTPTAVSKGAVRAEMLIEVCPRTGDVLHGSRKSFSEMKLHLAAYRARPDVRAVVHAHPPTATGFAVAGVALGPPFMAEPIVSIGSRIPLVPFGLPGDVDVAGPLAGADVLMLQNHGVLAVGPDLETCLLRIELLEHVCRVALVARQLGGAVPLPTAVVAKLQAKHDSLFPRAGGAVHASAPAPLPSGPASDIVAAALGKFRG